MMKKIFLLVLICFFPIGSFAELKPGTTAPGIPTDAIWITEDKPTYANGELKGKVVLVDIWDCECYNCIHTFPHLKELYSKYKKYGFEILGVHKGEFARAQTDTAYVARKYAQYGLPYPCIADTKDVLWNAYGSTCWPNEFLVDRNGVIQLNIQGEGNYDVLEKKIQELLKQDHPEYDFSGMN
ncbi:MAG TPA: redoxin domain-containing protein [Candidatus Kapabacteria bacterium]|nr:redoxin domain-containing protein [Candidatus Kapabacteria bacterium]